MMKCKPSIQQARFHSCGAYIDEFFSSKLQAKRFLLLATVNHNRPHTHCFRQLNSLNTDTASTTWEDDPLARFQARIDQSPVHCRGGAHDRPCDFIGNSVGNATGVCESDSPEMDTKILPACVNRGRCKILSVRSLGHEACVGSFLAVVLSSLPALLAIVAYVKEGFNAGTVSDLPSLSIAAEFDLKRKAAILVCQNEQHVLRL